MNKKMVKKQSRNYQNYHQIKRICAKFVLYQYFVKKLIVRIVHYDLYMYRALSFLM